MNGKYAIEQAKITLDNLRADGFSLEDLAAIIGVTRPTATKYTYHPEMMTLAEFEYIERFYSDYKLRKQVITEQPSTTPNKERTTE